MKIYTKTGDRGQTGLLGGQRVSKNDPCIEAIGEVDELNALLGVLITQTTTPASTALLQRIQKNLFTIGATLADVRTTQKRAPLTQEVLAMEQYIDELDSHLPELKNFILPGGTPFAAHTHLARAVCRRAERRVVGLPGIDDVVIYLNRLSDLLFVLARADCHNAGVAEEIWKS